MTTTKQRRTFTLSQQAIDVAERLAEDENRTLSNWLETLILRQDTSPGNRSAMTEPHPDESADLPV